MKFFAVRFPCQVERIKFVEIGLRRLFDAERSLRKTVNDLAGVDIFVRLFPPFAALEKEIADSAGRPRFEMGTGDFNPVDPKSRRRADLVFNLGFEKVRPRRVAIVVLPLAKAKVPASRFFPPSQGSRGSGDSPSFR